MRYIYRCEDSAEGIFSAVYRAYEEGHGHENNEIRIRRSGENCELFTEYVEVETDYERAWKVARTLGRDISPQAYDFVLTASLCYKPEKADAIYRFIIDGLRLGGKIMNHLTLPYMQTMFDLERQLANEAHYWVEFLRFEEMANDMLFARINPKSVVLPRIAGHFADRFSGEDWVIADTTHGTAMIHRKENAPVYMAMEDVDFEKLELEYSEEEQDMQRLWKTFVDSIAIRERVNPNLQRQMLPLRYRKYMKEFS